jgi:hypothetical protein
MLYSAFDWLQVMTAAIEAACVAASSLMLLPDLSEFSGTSVVTYESRIYCNFEIRARIDVRGKGQVNGAEISGFFESHKVMIYMFARVLV